MGAKWIKIAVVYFAFGIAYGLFMHYTVELKWAAVHAHINLMGWVTSGVIGLIYSYYKEAGETSLAKAQFWLYQIGLPFFLLGIILIYLDVPRYMMEICVSGGGIAVSLSVVLFIVNVFKNIKS
ncbi:hypothetical protein [Rummeliibacillus pycnus]|uniref:hypothetical protein n=1 Tax=Rummeliibacillus pycnus TaxID=101070 RepID=UPI0037CB8590